MELLVRAPVLDLTEGEVLTLIDAEGARIAARCGRVWVTEEGDRRDHILGIGDSFLVKRGGRTVVQALEAARVAIGRPASEEA
jgi:hypothetical protein